MRPVIALLVTLAAAVSAAPGSAAADSGSSLLLGRQNCIYQCSCGSFTGDPNPASATCCATVGGSWDGNLCSRLSDAQERSYKSCCGSSGALCFGPPGCTPP